MPITRMHRPFGRWSPKQLRVNATPDWCDDSALVVGIDRGISSPSVIVLGHLHPKAGLVVVGCAVLHGCTMYRVRDHLQSICDVLPESIALGPDGAAKDPHSGTTDIDILAACGCMVTSLRTTPEGRDHELQLCLSERGGRPRLRIAADCLDVQLALAAYEAQGDGDTYRRRGVEPTLHVIDALGYMAVEASRVHRYGRTLII
jgi:hypothetical protein